MATENWKQQLKTSDEDTFRELVEPHTEALIEAAQRVLRYYRAQGAVHDRDFTAEELAGEALIQAHRHRDRIPEAMELRPWLVGTLYRVARGLVEQLRAYRAEKALSLDAPVPTEDLADDTQEWFYDWYQPERSLVWEDVIPSREPVDVEVPIDADPRDLDEDTYHVLTLHQEFEMSLPEVAFTMNRSVREIQEMLQQARTSALDRDGGAEPIKEADHPTPSS